MNGLTHVAGAIAWASLQGAVVVGLVLLAQRLLGSRVHPRWHYALWGLVLVRLLAPVLPQTPWSIFNLWAEPVPRAVAVAAEEDKSAPPTVRLAATFEPAAVTFHEPATTTPTAPPVAVNRRSPTETSTDSFPIRSASVLAGVWLVVAALLLTRLAVSYALLLRRVRRAAVISDPGLLELLDRCRARMRVRSRLPLLETDAVTGPALVGLVRPKLLIPPGMLDRLKYRQVALVMMHELAHHRSRDLAVNWLLSVATAIHWFNPLVWWAARRMIADRELVRDADVLDGLRPLDRTEYGRALISMTRLGGAPLLQPLTVGLTDRTPSLHRRIQMIASPKPYRRAWSLLAALSIATLGLLTLTDAAPAAQAAPAEAAKQPAASTQPAQETGGNAGSVAENTVPESGAFKDMPVLDLTGWSAEQIAKIPGIKDIAVVLIDEEARPAFAGVPMKDVASVVSVPAGMKKRLMAGQVKLSASSFAPANAEDTVLIIAGQAIVTEPIEKVTYSQVIIAGQAVVHRGGEAALSEKLSSVTGQLIYTKAAPRVTFGDETLDRAFFELVEQPISLVCFGSLTIAPDVTPELLREKVASIHIFGSVTADERLHPMVRHLTEDLFGEISQP